MAGQKQPQDHFKPLREKARWRFIYDELLSIAKVGDIITYAQLAEVLDVDPEADRAIIQMAMQRAAKEFEQEDKHALTVVRNTGYRVVEAKEHLDLARQHSRKAGRSLARGHSKAVNVDLSGLEPEARRAFEVVALAFAQQMDFNKRLTERQDRLEKTVQDIAGAKDRDAEEISELRRRLDQLEQGR